MLACDFFLLIIFLLQQFSFNNSTVHAEIFASAFNWGDENIGGSNVLSSNINENGVSHAFVQTGSELLYFRDISHQDIRLSINNGVEKYEILS